MWTPLYHQFKTKLSESVKLAAKILKELAYIENAGFLNLNISNQRDRMSQSRKRSKLSINRNFLNKVLISKCFTSDVTFKFLKSTEQSVEISLQQQ